MRRWARLTILVLVAVFSLSLSGLARAEEPSFTFSSKFWSKYLGSNGALIHGKPVLQTDFLIGLPKGFYVDLWHSMGLDGTELSSDLGDEIDYVLGWNGRVYNFGVDLGIMYLDLVDLFKMPGGDLLELYGEVGKEYTLSKDHAITPYLRADFLFPAGGDDMSSGAWLAAGLKHSWRLGEGFSFNQKLGLVYDTGAIIFDRALIGAYNAGISWQATKSLAVDILQLKLSAPITSVSDGRKPEVVIGIGLSVRF